MPSTELTKEQITNGEIAIPDLLVITSLAQSKGEARRLIQQGGISIDKEKVTDFAKTVSADELKQSIVIKKGKKIFHKVSLK